jgi:hypothetical protein
VPTTGGLAVPHPRYAGSGWPRACSAHKDGLINLGHNGESRLIAPLRSGDGQAEAAVHRLAVQPTQKRRQVRTEAAPDLSSAMAR